MHQSTTFPAHSFESPSGHSLGNGDDAWSIVDYSGFVLCGPYASVRDGLYRIKVTAEVEGPQAAYFEVVDFRRDARVYASRRFRTNSSVIVRVFESDGLEVRFRTSGERLVMSQVEIEPILLDQDVVDASALRALAQRFAAEDVEISAALRLFDRFADLGAVGEAEQWRREDLARRSEQDPASEVWRRLTAIHGPTIAPGDISRWRTLSEAQVAEVIWRMPLELHDLVRAGPETRERLVAKGLNPDFILASRLHRDYDEPTREWHDRPLQTGHSGQFPIRQPLFESHIEIDRSHQSSLARGEGMPAYCPITGQLLRSHHAFVLHYGFKAFIFYRFEGAQTFYLCTGHNSDSRILMYFPSSQVVVWIGDPWHSFYKIDEIVRHTMLYAACNIDAVLDYLRRPTTLAAIMGNDNYGHYLNVDISGLQFCVENNFHKNLTALVKVPQQFISVEEIFPELNELNIITTSAYPNEVFRTCVEQRLLPIHFTDVTISHALFERIQRSAVEHASELSQGASDAVRPLIWINLRAHNKTWLDQVEGHANILNALADEYGAVTAYMDGMPDCADILHNIQALTSDRVRFIDGLSASFYDKLMWARHSDAYLCVIGTGLIIVHSLGGIRGVAHGNHEHLSQLRFWHTIREGSETPIAPSYDQIVDGSGDELQRNYDVDWRVLLDLLRSVLADCTATPLRRP